ncbi:MAG: hypothetical protein WCO29_15515, partial [Nostocales cyanobacterium ELA583]
MNINLQLALDLAYNQLNTVAQSPEYWTILNSIFGTNYNSVLAQTLQQEWQAGNFSTLPPVEILNSSILGKANGAYAASNNTIYLADTFVATATSAQLVAVLLEEIGHAVDAKINSSDTPGDEGELFSLLVRGITPSGTELSRIQSENDQAIITLDGQPVAIEMDVNEAPVITSAATASFAENGTGTVYTVTATDIDADTTLTYSLSGDDADLFNINNGAVTFKTTPNFELPGDSGENNVYDINVIANDGTSTATQAVAITVTNVNDEAPVITSAATASFAENGT